MKIHGFDSSGRRQVFEYRDTANGNAVCMYALQQPGKSEYDLSFLTEIRPEEFQKALENGVIPAPFLEHVSQAAPDFSQPLKNLHNAPSVLYGGLWKISRTSGSATRGILYESKDEIQRLSFSAPISFLGLGKLDWEKIVILANEGKAVYGVYRQIDFKGGLEFVIRWGKLPCAKDKEEPRYQRTGPERFLSLHNTNGIVLPRQEILNGQRAEDSVKPNSISYRVS